jgi:MYXO-CTERM domain-containing protein
MPSHGRYVDRPAIADEQGVIAIPPPVFDPLKPILVGLGVVAFLGMRRRRHQYA